jgi:D-alanyl-D-alanine carboxypeptidase
MKKHAVLAGSSILFLFFGLHPIAAKSQTVDSIDPALQRQIDSIATEVLQKSGVPAASLAVVQDGKLVYTHAYGLARIEPREPATTEMRFAVGSISKQFTAAGQAFD